MIPPTTMHESATLNVGQKCSAMKSITDAVVGPEHPVGQVAERASHDEPERDGDGRRLHPAHRAQQHEHGDDGETTEHRGPALGEAEGGAGVVGQLEVELPHDVDGAVRQPVHGPRLRHLVDGHHHGGDGPGDEQAPKGVAPRTLPVAQRRCSPPLLHDTHSRA